MKKVLINGCSFAQIWTPSEKFSNFIGCSPNWPIINLGKAATGFQRTCRSTIEWIAQNGNPDFIIIPITFSHRLELAISEKDDELDGTWQPLQMASIMPKDLNTLYQKIDPSVDHAKLKKFLELYYGIIPNIRTYWDRVFTEIIMLAGYLDSRKIPYLMFDMCNDFNLEYLKNCNGFDKLNLIRGNKKIIDIINFCGNKHMYDSMEKKPTEGVVDKHHYFNIHHSSEQYLVLEAYLEHYMKQNGIIQ
tara:strand:- start:367 stop:1107 length:741 start_codon:yes stop_codon:yes gene_type:complete